MNGSTWRERDLRTDLEQATLRVRLAATALGATLLLLVPGHDQVAAAALLVGYAMVALVLRAHGARIPWSGRIGVGMDVLFATALSLLLPVSAAWVLYLFAIGIAALRAGVPGLAVATAGSVLSYDLVLALRGGAAPASDLWRIQVLLAFALLAAELTWVAVRTRQERDGLRSFSLAQRDIAATRSADELLDRLVDHAVRSFGATGAWVDQGESGAPRHARGRIDITPSETDAIEVAGGTTLNGGLADWPPSATSRRIRGRCSRPRPSACGSTASAMRSVACSTPCVASRRRRPPRACWLKRSRPRRRSRARARSCARAMASVSSATSTPRSRRPSRVMAYRRGWERTVWPSRSARALCWCLWAPAARFTRRTCACSRSSAARRRRRSSGSRSGRRSSRARRSCVSTARSWSSGCVHATTPSRRPCTSSAIRSRRCRRMAS